MTADPPRGTAVARPWHGVWPADVPRSFDYPQAPAWWLLERSVTRFPDRPAVCDLEHETGTVLRTVTYAGLLRAARGVAAGLRAAGLADGARVAFCLPNSADLVIAYFGTWLAGGVAVPANPAARAGELEQQVADAAVAGLIAPRASVAATVAERLEVALIDVDGFRALQERPPAPPAPVVPDDVAVLLYTGGTTGVPKGAMLTHQNLVANTIQFAEWYGFEPGAEVSVAAIPMFHSGGMSGVMNVPLYAGATLLAFARFNAGVTARAVTRHRVTRLFGVPAMFIALLDDAEGRRADYAALRACRTNAAPLPPTVKGAFDALVGRPVLVEGYGLTETSPLTHANPRDRAKPGSIGIPLPDTDARLVDLDTGIDVVTGGRGELLIRGPQVMRGYWRRPAETAEVLTDGWLRTGDVAVMDDEGYFAIVDRKKDLINTAGFKVWPREVEEALYAHPAVKMAAVIGVPDGYRGEAVAAWVVLRDEDRGRVTAETLTAFCRERLSGYKVPRRIELAAALPLTDAGKLLRRALRSRAAPAESPSTGAGA